MFIFRINFLDSFHLSGTDTYHHCPPLNCFLIVFSPSSFGYSVCHSISATQLIAFNYFHFFLFSEKKCSNITWSKNKHQHLFNSSRISKQKWLKIQKQNQFSSVRNVLAICCRHLCRKSWKQSDFIEAFTQDTTR